MARVGLIRLAALLLAVTPLAAQVTSPVQTVAAVPSGSCNPNGRVVVVNTGSHLGESFCCVSGSWAACDLSIELSTKATSGAGTSGDPWVIDATGWNAVKGGPIRVREGWYQVGHGAELDISTGTRIMCEPGASFVLPATQRTVTNPMFVIDDDATGVSISGCTFEPGISVSTGDMCQSGTDTGGGINYLQVGRVGDSGAAEFEIVGNRFKPCRRASASRVCSQLTLKSGVHNGRIEDNVFDIAYAHMQLSASHASASNVYENLTIRGNVFDMQAYDNVPCGKAYAAIEADHEKGSASRYTFAQLVITDNIFDNSDQALTIALDGNGLIFSDNIGVGAYFDGFISANTSSSVDNYRIEGNTCDDGATGLLAQGCEFTLLDWDYGIIADNKIRSVGINFFSFSSVDAVLIENNYIDTRRTSANSANCMIVTGTCNDIVFRNNYCVDTTDMVELNGTLSGIQIYDNVLDTNSPGSGVLSRLVNIAGGTCTNCSAWSNHARGENLTTANWTNSETTFAFWGDNHWNIDLSSAATRRGALRMAGTVTGATWILDPGTVNAPLTWTNPGDLFDKGGRSLVANNTGGIAWGESYRVDQFGTDTFSSANTGSYTNPTNANNTDLTTYALHQQASGSTAAVTHDWTWTAGTVGNYMLEVFYTHHSGSGAKCTTPSNVPLNFYYCATAACTPTTLFHTFTGDTTQNDVRHVILPLTSVDPGNVEFRAELIGNGATGPGRCEQRIRSLKLSSATHDVVPPLANSYVLFPNTSATTFGQQVWADGTQAAYNTGTEACAAIGLTCKDAYVPGAAVSGCGTAQTVTYVALCHE